MYLLSVSDDSRNSFGNRMAPYVALLSPVMPTREMVEASIPVNISDSEMDDLIDKEELVSTSIYLMRHEVYIGLHWIGEQEPEDVYNNPYDGVSSPIRRLLEIYRFPGEIQSPTEMNNSVLGNAVEEEF